MAVAVKHILLVGRDTEDANKLARLLAKSNYQVTVVEDENEALGTVLERDVDLVITDHDNEFIDGIHLTRQLKQANTEVKIVMVSRLLDLDTYLRVMNEGCYDCLEAPFKTEELLRVVENALHRAAEIRSGLN